MSDGGERIVPAQRNEPDLLGDVGAGYTDAGYRADVAAYQASIATVSPGTALSGPVRPARPVGRLLR